MQAYRKLTLNWRLAGSTPVSATMFSWTYGLCATMRHDALRSSKKLPNKHQTRRR